MGPTASGKTDLAFSIADEFPCEIISVDSVMVYKGLDIGSAKPDADTLKKYPHHLVDILEPNQHYSAANFRDDALHIIKESHDNNKIPLLVGGTLLYFGALLRGLSKMPSADLEIRKKISDLAEEKGWEYVHARLAEVDPLAAERIHPNDPQRIQRAMEVYELTGTPISDWHSESEQNELPFKALKLALIPEDRAHLHKLIEQRFDLMLEQGFLEEAQKLYQGKTLHADLPSMRSVGYRQAWKHFSGEYDVTVMREKAIIATRQLAKRQLTWLRSESSLSVNSAEKPDIHDVHQQIRSYLA
ncbi:MAG: tRNA (adenosine(37)-N6)-dimethylallyltransferase MiaA [Gammaproteobacteria bacterium]|nr:MAG: tRNA (adenosine(37)-N6)-dimethylallyltransferase MiaA [Gammaproteobacteria bacterium]